MHPIVVTLIIVAIALAVILGFVSYLLSLWSVEQHNFIIRPILYARGAEIAGSKSTQPLLILYVSNEGPRSVKIIRVELIVGKSIYVNETEWLIPPGSKLKLEINDWKVVGEPTPIEPGNIYRVYIYTDLLGKLMYDIVLG